jgi:hypothetical protein
MLVFAVSVLRTLARRFGLRLTLRVRVAHCDLGRRFGAAMDHLFSGAHGCLVGGACVIQTEKSVSAEPRIDRQVG